MTINIILIILFLLGLTATGQVRSGYIYYDKVILELPEYSSSQKKLETLKFQMQDSLSILSKQFQNFMESLLVDKYMDSLAKKTLNDSILSLGNNISKYKELAFDRFRIEEQSIQSILKNQLIKKIKDFSRENNIDCITEKQALLYCDNCVDLTNELIKYLHGKQ